VRWSQAPEQTTIEPPPPLTAPTTTSSDDELFEDEEEDEVAAKKREIARLKAAEKFIEQGTGVFVCKVCAYKYDPSLGDAAANVPPGDAFADLPASWRCPTCRAQKDAFEAQVLKIAGFAENQQFGFGGNTMTEEGKSGLIFGSLAAFFLLFMAGYLLN